MHARHHCFLKTSVNKVLLVIAPYTIDAEWLSMRITPLNRHMAGMYVAMKEILKVIRFAIAITITTDLNSIGYVCINYFAISLSTVVLNSRDW